MNETTTKHLEAFLESRRQEGFRDIKGMRKNVKKFFRYLEEKGFGFTDVRFAEAQRFQGWLIEQKRYTSGSIINFIKGAKAFYDYLRKNGAVHTNPFIEIRRMRLDKKLPRNILKEKEMNRLLAAMRSFDGIEEIGKKRLRYRMHVLAEFLYSTACRISEAASVKADDIDFGRGVVEVTDAKSGYRRIVFLNEYAKEVLRLYVFHTRESVLTESNNRELLFGADGHRLCMVMNRELAEVTKGEHLPSMTSHGFRHAVGYHLLRAGCGIRQIQEILGHRAIRNTEVYTKVDKDDLREVLDRFHPRAFVKPGTTDRLSKRNTDEERITRIHGKKAAQTAAPVTRASS
jgi:site-specific recombinase XerD